MRIIAGFIAAFLTLGPTGLSDAREGPPTPVEAWTLAKVQRLGQAMYDQDIASARGTDALLARLNGQPPADLAG